jgi:hypothetical protein
MTSGYLYGVHDRYKGNIVGPETGHPVADPAWGPTREVIWLILQGPAFGDLFREFLASVNGGLTRAYPFQGLCSTARDASRVEPLVQPVLAVVALVRLSLIAVPLAGSPWARGDARLAADAAGFIYRYDSVLRPLGHGSGWARSHAPGFFTLETGHEYELYPGDASDKFRPHRNNPAQVCPHGDILRSLAMELTGPASYAAGAILINIVVTHVSTPI